MTIVYHRKHADISPNTEALHNTKTLGYNVHFPTKLIMNEKWLENFNILRTLCHYRQKYQCWPEGGTKTGHIDTQIKGFSSIEQTEIRIFYSGFKCLNDGQTWPSSESCLEKLTLVLRWLTSQ